MIPLLILLSLWQRQGEPGKRTAEYMQKFWVRQEGWWRFIGNWLFIEVSEEGRCAFVAAYNPNSLAKKASLAIVCTYKARDLEVGPDQW